jgi:hypothetical protein
VVELKIMVQSEKIILLPFAFYLGLFPILHKILINAAVDSSIITAPDHQR